MSTLTIESESLKALIKESVKEALDERMEKIEEAVVDVIEDYELGKAIEEGKTGRFIDNTAFKDKLNRLLEE